MNTCHDDTGDASGVNYYGLPAVKHSPWDWKVAAYLFVGALAGGAQLIAGIARGFGGARMAYAVRNARYIALLGAGTGAALLVRDLKTPQRFYNMMRILRETSPMSIGSYILGSFGTFSLAAAWKEWRSATPAPASAAQLPASLLGIGQCTYTAPLLATTSTPYWAAQPELLAARYGSSAIALAASTLSLLEQIRGRSHSARTLDGLMLVATAANAFATRAAERALEQRGVHKVLEEPQEAERYRTAKMLSITAPLACGALALLTRSWRLSIIASVSVIAGTALSKSSDITAGNRSADRPDLYLRFASGRDERGAA